MRMSELNAEKTRCVNVSTVNIKEARKCFTLS